MYKAALWALSYISLASKIKKLEKATPQRALSFKGTWLIGLPVVGLTAKFRVAVNTSSSDATTNSADINSNGIAIIDTAVILLSWFLFYLFLSEPPRGAWVLII